MNGITNLAKLKKMIVFVRGINKNYLLIMVAVCLLAFTPSLGFCDDATNFLDNMGVSLEKLLFGAGMRTVVLVFGAAMGVYKAVGSGQFWPLLTWGGIGCVVAFMPSAISFLAKLNLPT